jgi:hypothetical protein
VNYGWVLESVILNEKSSADINGLELILNGGFDELLKQFSITKNFHVDRWKPININWVKNDRKTLSLSLFSSSAEVNEYIFFTIKNVAMNWVREYPAHETATDYHRMVN